MPRTAFRQCGFITNGTAPSLDPLNGWFWPVTFTGIGSTGGNTPNPTDITAQQLFDLWWRISTLRCQGSYTRGAESFTFDYTFSDIFNSTETDLIAPGDDRWFVLNAILTSSTPTDYAVFVDVLLPLTIFEGFPADTRPFWPHVNIQFPGFWSNPGGGSWEASSATCTFLGRPITIYQVIGEPVTGSMEITADAYWSYGGIYDTSDGSQLITPLPTGL